MTWSSAPIAHTVAQSLTTNTIISSAIDTTGADTLFVEVSWYDGLGGTAVLTDSKSNTWNAMTARTNSGTGTSRSQFYYAKNATVGSGHTFTVTSTSAYPGVAVAAFSGGDLSAPYDSTAGESVGYSGGSSVVNPGSLTPTNDNSICIVTLQNQSGTNTPSIDGGFTISDYAGRVANGLGVGLAYLVQTSKAASNPQWSNLDTSFGYTTTQQIFIAAAGGGGATFTPRQGAVINQSRNRASTF